MNIACCRRLNEADARAVVCRGSVAVRAQVLPACQRDEGTNDASLPDSKP